MDNSILQEILANFLDVSVRDVIDVVLISVLYYYALLAIRGTRAVQILHGILALLVLAGFANIFKMYTLSYVLNGVMVSTVVALPVVFQPELRRALMHLGQSHLLHNRVSEEVATSDVEHIVSEIAFACFNLSLSNYGALIVWERGTGLQEIVETGQTVRGVISAKLLQTIFFPNTPLHDGAVVIRGKQVEAAACYLPLTDSVVDARFGTRHRAAIGISEQSDAIVIVVSEETGEMRIAREGKFSSPVTEESQLRTALSHALTQSSQRKIIPPVTQKRTWDKVRNLWPGWDKNGDGKDKHQGDGNL